MATFGEKDLRRRYAAFVRKRRATNTDLEEAEFSIMLDALKRILLVYLSVLCLAWPSVGIASLLYALPVTIAIALLSLCGVVPVLGQLVIAYVFADPVADFLERMTSIDVDRAGHAPGWIDTILTYLLDDDIAITGSTRDLIRIGAVLLSLAVTYMSSHLIRTRIVNLSWGLTGLLLLLALADPAAFAVAAWIEWPFPFERSISLTPWGDEPVEGRFKQAYYAMVLLVGLNLCVAVFLPFYMRFHLNREYREFRQIARSRGVAD